MLNHRAAGPDRAGKYVVGYDMPGCAVLAVVCECRTAAQAEDEAARLNAIQTQQEARQGNFCPECEANMRDYHRTGTAETFGHRLDRHP